MSIALRHRCVDFSQYSDRPKCISRVYVECLKKKKNTLLFLHSFFEIEFSICRIGRWKRVRETLRDVRFKKSRRRRTLLFLYTYFVRSSFTGKTAGSDPGRVIKHSVVVMQALGQIVETLNTSNTEKGLFFTWSPDGSRIGNARHIVTRRLL